MMRARRRPDLDEACIDLDACLDKPLVPHRDCDLDGCRIEARESCADPVRSGSTGAMRQCYRASVAAASGCRSP